MSVTGVYKRRTMFVRVKYQRVNHHLTAKQVSELRKLSRRRGVSVAELIRRAVENLLFQEHVKEKRS
jgi:hypothetical protein